MKVLKDTLKLYGIVGGYRSGDITAYINTVCDKVQAALNGGITLLQLREKQMDINDRVKLAKKLKKLCSTYSVPLIINDSVDVCLMADADGVHLGQTDDDICKARNKLGKSKIIGATVHNPAEAIQAEKEGADYIGSGAAFGSGTKSDAKKIDLNDYNIIIKSVSLPVVAIGGITADNAGLLSGRGLAGIAVISAIFECTDIERNTRLLKEKAEQL